MQWTLVALPFLSVAQPRQLIISARSGDSARPARTTLEETAHPAESAATDGSADTGGTVNTLPLFGERPKTAAQIDEEIHFLNDCDRNFSSRSEASSFFSARGWDYVSSGQLDTAAHRFNLAWLLNNQNSDAYWGLGVICYQKNLLADAIRMLRRGVAVDDSNTVLMTDLATVVLKQYQEKPNADLLTEAESQLQKAISQNPNALSLQKLSLVNFFKADYAKAWDYFHQARNLDLSVLDLSYLNELLAKQPDPKGVFK